MSKGVDEAVEDLNANPFFAAFIESEHYKPVCAHRDNATELMVLTA